MQTVVGGSCPEYKALMTTIAGLVVVLMLVLQKISDLFTLIKSLFSF